MMRREDFIDALGMPDEGFTNAVDAALRQVKEGEARPVMKRKQDDRKYLTIGKRLMEAKRLNPFCYSNS